MEPFNPEEEVNAPKDRYGARNDANTVRPTNPVPTAPVARVAPQVLYAPQAIPPPNLFLPPTPLVENLDASDLTDTRKRRKLSEYAHLEALHQLQSKESFANLQRASHQDLNMRQGRHEVEEDEFELAGRNLAFTPDDECEIDVLGSGDDGEDGHYVLSAQWQASRDSVRKKRKRKSFLFGERRDEHSERLSFQSPGETRLAPTKETEGRAHPKVGMTFGAKHARLHTARPGVYDRYEEGMDDDIALDAGDEEGERLQALYENTNVIVTKQAEEEDDEITIIDDDDVVHQQSLFKKPSMALRPVRSSTKSNGRSASPAAPMPRRSSRLNYVSVVEFEYDVEAQYEGETTEESTPKKKSASRGAHVPSSSEPSTPAHAKTPAPAKKTPKTSSARKAAPQSMRQTPVRRGLVHGIVTTQDVTDFYASLQPTHYQTKAQQPKGMVPVLFSYQLRAVSWMMERENLLWMKDGVRGGILADEMGLGKTIEMIGLIISNPRSKFLPPSRSAPSKRSKPSEMEVDGDGEAKGPLTLRLKLETFVEPPEALHDGGCTLIVCPEILLSQWKEEMQRHAPSLNVHTYKGVPNLSALEKALDVNGENIFVMNDVVLCSYETLAKEFPYATKPAVKTRFQQPQPSTPLGKLRWWRLIMDEAQMFSQGASNAGKLLRHLDSVHRWAVSGTPIRRDFSDLRGLLVFLDAEASYFKPTPETLAFLKQIAWRHQMEQVSDEIIIPPSETHLLKVRFNALEAFGASKLAAKLKTRLSYYNGHDPSIAPNLPQPDHSTQTSTSQTKTETEIVTLSQPNNTSPANTAAESEVLALQTGKYASCPYQVLLERYLEKSTVIQASDRAILSRSLSTHLSNEFYASQIAVCRAFNAYGDALLTKCRKLKLGEKNLTSSQKSYLDLLLSHTAVAYQQALDLVMYKTNTPIHEKLVALRTPLFDLNPPSTSFSAVWYHTLSNMVETMRYQGREEEALKLEQRAESVRGTALQSQLNSVASARFKFISTKQETSRIARNRRNTPRSMWWKQALLWIGENVPDFCSRLRRGVRQLIDTQFQVARTQILQLNVATVEDVIDKLELDFDRMDSKRFEAISLAKTPVPTSGIFLDEFYDTLDRTDDTMHAYQQLLVRDVETDGFSGLIQTKVLNLAERLILYIEFVLVERHNILMTEYRFHPERLSAQDETTMFKLVRWLLQAEASFRELELMKFELDHAQSFNKAKRDYAASLENLEHSALPQVDEDALTLPPNGHSMDIDESPTDSAALSLSEMATDKSPETENKSEVLLPSLDSQHLQDLRAGVVEALENCVSVKHQLEFVLEAGREKIPTIEGFGSKLSVVAAKLLEVLQDDADQLANPSLLRNKALVFSKWSEPLIQLSLFLRGQGIQFCFGKDAGGLDGPRQSKNMGQRLASFRDDPEVRVLFLNSKSQSTGLTLTQANHVFILEDIESAHELQAIGRAHRIGQTRVTHIWKAVVDPGEVPSFYEDVSDLVLSPSS